MITRLTGLSPGVPWAGPLPGGGYNGKTRRLDRAVARFAEWLQRHFDCDVQVRFNSHRLSGGAFIYPGAKGRITFNTPEIGLGARLITPLAVKQKHDRAWEEGTWDRLPPLEREDCWTEETPLDYNVLGYPEVLRNPSDLGEWTGNRNAAFGYWTVATAQEAYRLLRRLTVAKLIRNRRRYP